MARPYLETLDTMRFADHVADLQKGPKCLGYGDWGFAALDDILVLRDLEGCFHYIGEGRCECELYYIEECDVTIIRRGLHNIEDGSVTVTRPL